MLRPDIGLRFVLHRHALGNEPGLLRGFFTVYFGPSAFLELGDFLPSARLHAAGEFYQGSRSGGVAVGRLVVDAGTVDDILHNGQNRQQRQNYEQDRENHVHAGKHTDEPENGQHDQCAGGKPLQKRQKPDDGVDLRLHATAVVIGHENDLPAAGASSLHHGFVLRHDILADPAVEESGDQRTAEEFHDEQERAGQREDEGGDTQNGEECRDDGNDGRDAVEKGFG